MHKENDSDGTATTTTSGSGSGKTVPLPSSSRKNGEQLDASSISSLSSSFQLSTPTTIFTLKNQLLRDLTRAIQLVRSVIGNQSNTYDNFF